MFNSSCIVMIPARVRTLLGVLLLAVASPAQKGGDMPQLIDKVMLQAAERYADMASGLEKGKMPRTFSGGRLVQADIGWWCSGFYPGTLWYLYEYTGSGKIRELAHSYTELLKPLLSRKTDHDIGFQLFCSFGNGYRLTGNPAYLDILRRGAAKLAGRFNPAAGTIRSWDHSHDKWEYPVIIDNMMNLGLLEWVGCHDGNDTLRSVAVAHANTTMRNHFRPDFSSYHLVDYDTATGRVIKKQTVQGYSDESKWARGQAWALYGYTMMYRYTGNPLYLAQARGIADMLIPLLPQDGIPYWDFDSPDIPADVRDASAAAIMASALVELSGFAGERRGKYLEVAERQLRSLASPSYMAAPGTNGNFLLMHSVGSKPGKSEVDVPLTYADYYFVEALMRLQKAAVR